MILKDSRDFLKRDKQPSRNQMTLLVVLITNRVFLDLDDYISKGVTVTLSMNAWVTNMGDVECVHRMNSP